LRGPAGAARDRRRRCAHRDDQDRRPGSSGAGRWRVECCGGRRRGARCGDGPGRGKTGKNDGPRCSGRPGFTRSPAPLGYWKAAGRVRDCSGRQHRPGG
jgi:hypothetical protein